MPARPPEEELPQGELPPQEDLLYTETAQIVEELIPSEDLQTIQEGNPIHLQGAEVTIPEVTTRLQEEAITIQRVEAVDLR